MLCLGLPLFNAEIRQYIASESILRDTGDLINLRLKRQLTPKSLTFQAEEVNQLWYNELLKRLASSKPSTLPEGPFLCPVVTRSDIRFGNIRKVDVGARSVLIPSKNGIDRRSELDCVLLIDATGVYPEVLQSISSCLLRAELYLTPPSLAQSLAYVRAGFHVLKEALLVSLGMREYCVGRDIAAGRLAKDDLAVGCAL